RNDKGCDSECRYAALGKKTHSCTVRTNEFRARGTKTRRPEDSNPRRHRDHEGVHTMPSRSLRAIVLMIAVLLPAGVSRGQQDAAPDYKNPSLPVERRVADLLSRMTLEEKIAQTQGLWAQKALIEDNSVFSPEKAKTVLKYGLGEISRPSEKTS